MVWGLRYIEYLRKNWSDIAERVKEVAKRYGKVHRIVVFGSVVKDKITGSSDLDIAIFYDENLSDKEKLRRTLEILNEFDEEVVIDLKVMRKDEVEFFLKLVDKYVDL